VNEIEKIDKIFIFMLNFLVKSYSISLIINYYSTWV